MKSEFDVLVLGGGLEGCTVAALAASAGLKVVLTENSGSLGGLATNGLYSFFPGEPGASSMPEESWKIRTELLDSLGIEPSTQANRRPILYKEQKLKIVLADLLTKRGVKVLTHVYISEPILEGSTLAGFVLRGKTGAKTLKASWVIDATGYARTAICLGIGIEYSHEPAYLGIKMNGVNLGVLASTLRETTIELESKILGTLDCSFAWMHRGISVFAKELRILGFLDDRELIIHGLGAKTGGIDPFAVSSVQIALRQGAYKLLEHLRMSNPAFSLARIIHVATKMHIGRLEVREEPRTFGNLIFCGTASAYDNDRAIIEGTLAARKLTSVGQNGILRPCTA